MTVLRSQPLPLPSFQLFDGTSAAYRETGAAVFVTPRKNGELSFMNDRQFRVAALERDSGEISCFRRVKIRESGQRVVANGERDPYFATT